MAKNKLTTIFLVVFVDLFGFGLILPLLPFYAQEYNASKTVIGFLVASYAAAQFIGAPILGRLSDRFGRRPVLLASILGTAIGFVLLAVADPLGRALGATWFAADSAVVLSVVVGVLFVSRILDGLTGGNISVAQAYITDVTAPEERARGLGLIGAAFGLGFILGPAIGGALSQFGFAAPAWLAAAFAFANLIAVYLFLPESLSAAQRARSVQKPRPLFDFRPLFAALTQPRIGPLLNVRLYFGLAFAMFQTIFTLYAAGDPLNLSVQTTGYVLAYVGILAAFVQGFLMGRISGRFEDTRLILYTAIGMAVALFGWALTPNLTTLLIVLAPLAFCGGILRTVLSSALTKAVAEEDVGEILGFGASLDSLTRIVAPSAGGFLLGAFGYAAPGLVTTLIMLLVIYYIWQRLVQNPDPPLVTVTDAGVKP